MSTAVLHLNDREVFERNVTWAVAAGAVAGAVHLLLERFHLAPPWPALVLVGAALSSARGDRLGRLRLASLALVLPALAWCFSMSEGWTVALGGAAVGLLGVRARISERGEEGQLARARPGRLNEALGAGLGAAGARVGTEIGGILAARLATLDTPLLLSAIAGGAVIALFVALASVAAHLALMRDPVEARCEALIATVAGEFRTQASRALSLYRRCGETMSRLPRDPAREELARALSELTRGTVELASEWSGVEGELAPGLGGELQAEIDALGRSAREARDPIARSQLEMAAASLGEERLRLEALQLRRERVLAKLKSDVALLEGARVALIGLRGGQAQLRGAELASLSRRLSALAQRQRDEAAWASELATSVDLTQLERGLTPPESSTCQ